MDTSKGLPIKIENDGLKDSIVAINFTTDYNLKKLEELLIAQLNNYTKDEIPFKPVPLREIDKKIEGNIMGESNHFYTNGIYKVQIEPTRLSFNCIDHYVGWKEYFNFILICVQSINQCVTFYTNVGVKYVSFFPNALREMLDGEIKLTYFSDELCGSIYQLRCGTQNNDYKGTITLRLQDRAMIKDEIMTIVDITSESVKSEMQIKEMLSTLCICHNFEKDMFFKVLKQSFVDTKNPIN